MQTLKIKKLSMSGFKNHKEKVEYAFNDYTVVSGDNGQGKTTVGEGAVWGMLGSNLWGNEKADAKLVNESSKTAEVEITFIADGIEHSIIRRKNGRCTDIYLDDQIITNSGVIQKLGIDKKTFFTIFNPAYFSTLEPKEAKEFLLKVLQDVSKDEVFDEMGDFYRDLLTQNGFKNADMFLDDKRQEMKAAEEDLIYLQGIIDGSSATTVIAEPMNFDDKELKNLQWELSELESQQLTVPHDISALKDKRANFEKQIIILQSKQPELKDTSELLRQLDHEKMMLNMAPVNCPTLIDIKALEDKKTSLAAEYKALVKEYQSIEKVTIECPNCSTEIDVNEREKARLKQRYEQVREQGLQTIKEIESASAENERRMVEYNSIITEQQINAQKKIDELENQFYIIQNENLSTRETHLQYIESKSHGIRKQIEMLNIPILEAENKAAIEQFNTQKAFKRLELKKRIEILSAEQMKVIQHNASIEATLKQQELATHKVDKAKDDINKIEAKKNLLKQLIDAAKKFNAVKLELQSKMIGQYLDKVSIRLQRLVPSTGEVKDDFSILYEGKEFAVLSTSERIKAGLEISNLVMNVLNVRYPIFIDNKESITSYNRPDTQIIEAVVVPGQELKIA